MTQFYLPRELSDYIDAHGGRDFLAELVRERMNPSSPPEPQSDIRDAYRPITPGTKRFCHHCGLKLQTPGARICFHCQKAQ